MTVGHLDQIATALGAALQVQLRWRGEELDRLIDAAHAAMQQAVAAMLSDLGWIVPVEVSFNHYGDRGRIDIMAFHPGTRVVLIVEIKSAIGDLQETLGRLDVKLRLASRIAHDLGWTDVAAYVGRATVARPPSGSWTDTTSYTAFARATTRA
jgi:hypothetical protein